MKKELGEYKGCLSENIDDYLSSLDPKRAEVEVFLIYRDCHTQRYFYLKGKQQHTKELDSLLEELNYAMFYLMKWVSNHIGVTFEPPNVCDSFWKWFRFWDDHFNRTASRWKEFNSALSNGGGILPRSFLKRIGMMSNTPQAIVKAGCA